MAAVKELIRNEANGTLSFGDYTLSEKTKKDGFEFEGDLYKVKTFHEITKLEKNGVFVYESVPGTAVENFKVSDNVVTFRVSGAENAQITVGLEPEAEYVVYMNDINVGDMTTNISAKLSISAELEKEDVEVKIIKK
ncbi:MAG: endosialidase [bacterium]|nr:endosialidase [bacterium]